MTVDGSMDKTLEDLKVLIVDRNRDMRTMVRHMLRQLGIYNVVSATTMVSVFDKLAARDVDVILVAEDLGVWSDIELAALVRSYESPSMAALPIVLMARPHMSTQRLRCSQEAGVTVAVRKPFTVDTLHSVLSTVTHQRNLKAEELKRAQMREAA